MIKVIGTLLFTTGVIFGGRGIFKRWLHRQRMCRNDRYKQKLREAYKRRFREGQATINEWREEVQPEKHLNVICKNPAFAAAWE